MPKHQGCRTTGKAYISALKKQKRKKLIKRTLDPHNQLSSGIMLTRAQRRYSALTITMHCSVYMVCAECPR